VAEVASDAAVTVRFGGRDFGWGVGGEVRRDEREGMGELRVRMRDEDEIDEGARSGDTGGMTSELYSTSTA
jgi:hypothetical protein